jgi:hypothetical protein
MSPFQLGMNIWYGGVRSAGRTAIDVRSPARSADAGIITYGRSSQMNSGALAGVRFEAQGFPAC